ncbi:MAG: riboflavin biosynthesis protein RibF [Oscillospiraceae bacterium]|nr:riboflavin biosynthesis protein RibF [Oscillospiraceae bacterium]
MNSHGSVIALGFFDGVHRGHGALLRRTREQSVRLGVSPAVFTFDRPPKEVVTGCPVPLLNTAEDRCDLIRRLYGIEQVILAPFDRAMMTMDWQDFISLLTQRYGAVHLVAGHDYRFGYRNEGSPELLQRHCAELGLGCDIIPRVDLHGVTVSSTHIRSLIDRGDVEQAADFLGHPHCMSQTVTHGRRIGSTIGTPTFNFLPPAGVLLPARGVYATRTYLPDGRCREGVTNVGVRPTVDRSGVVSVETYLFDFSGELYGQHLRLDFCCYLRPEREFPSLDALRRQIRQDTEDAKRYFSENKSI